MGWRVTRDDANKFRQGLWKDERTFERISDGCIFVKDCFTFEAAQREFNVLQLLRALNGEFICPEPLRVEASKLFIAAVDGMRLFEVLWCLDKLERQRRDGVAAAAKVTLLGRQRQRLARIQMALLEHRQYLATVPYPLEDKLETLLLLLTHVFGLSVSNGEREALREFGDYWMQSCSQIPFRDATPKNTFVVHPRLKASSRFTLSDMEAVGLLIDSEAPTIWNSVGLMDIDFTSVEHDTSLEDDPISLHFHELTYGSCPLEATSLLLVPSMARSDSYRTAATLVVRYLRFGGRKLAYKVINSQGFEIRFRFDDPLFYFKKLGPMVEDISPQFHADFAPLLNWIDRIGTTAATPTQADRELLQVDHFRKFFGHGADYWQECPVAYD